MAGAWPFQLAPDTFGGLQFHDFPGAGIEEVATSLYETEPEFMAALEADVREHGVHQPVELANADTIWDGHHRIAAAYRVGQPVPVAFYGEHYPKDRDAEASWGDLRAAHPQEQAARMAHRPQTWEPRRAEPEHEAGQ